MPLSLSEQLSYSTVRIECKLVNGSTSSGTGFFYSFKTNNGFNAPAIVTNKHVVENAVEIKVIFTAADGNLEPLDDKHISWNMGDSTSAEIKSHPDDDVDLCAIPISKVISTFSKLNLRVFFRTLDENILLGPQNIDTVDAYEDILMIGYPNGLWDEKNNKPLFRKGITASHPKFDYSGKKEIIIDAACFPGSSGSPVFIFNNGSHKKKGGPLSSGDRIILLGVLYAGPQHQASGKILNVPIAHIPIIVGIPNNLGVVIKAERLLELEEVF